MKMPRIRVRPIRLALWIIVLAGAGAVLARYLYGIGAVTNLTDRFPWGLWIGFDVMSGVALAAGGFTVAAAVHVFKLHRYHALLRPAILTGFLGYVLVIAALMVDLGRPWNIWHPVVMWNAHSVMFEVAWCVMLYTSVLALEFGQIVLQRLRLWTVLRVTRLALPPLVIAGVLLSTLHQSSLGSLFLIVPGKLHPLWYTPMLPVLFFISAITVGLAMVTAEATLAERAFGHHVEVRLLTDLGRTSAVVLSLYLGVKAADLVARGALGLAFAGGIESVMFLVEVVGGIITPLVLLAIPGVARSRAGLAASAWLVVGGVILNRLNVAVTGMLTGSGVRYVPAWTEILITAAIVSGGVLTYIYIVEHLPVFSPAGETAASAPADVRTLQPAP